MIYNLLKRITLKRGELFPAEGFLYGILILFPNNIEYWKEINMVVNATKVLRTEYKNVTIIRNNVHLKNISGECSKEDVYKLSWR